MEEYVFFIRFQDSLDGGTQHNGIWMEEKQSFVLLLSQMREGVQAEPQRVAPKDRVRAIWGCRGQLIHGKQSRAAQISQAPCGSASLNDFASSKA